AQRGIGTEFHDDAGQQHRACGRRRDVTCWRPGMEWPDTGENRKSQKQNRESPRLELWTELKLGQLLEIQCGRCVSGPSIDVNGEDPDENECAAEEGVKRQLHRAVLLVGRSPDRDEEIFRDDHQFIENEKKEKIGAEKDAIRTAYDKKEPEEEFV